MPKTPRESPRCTQCGGPVRRAHRSEEDLRDKPGSGWRRYRCRKPECGWHGLLPRATRGAVRQGPVTGLSPGRLWALGGGLLMVIVLLSAALAYLALSPEPGAIGRDPGSLPAGAAAAPALQPRR